jgi:hypothetical protein
MANLIIEAPLVDGSLMPYISELDSCRDAVSLVCGDDLRPPPNRVKIVVITSRGKRVEILIPNGDGQARVTIDGEET